MKAKREMTNDMYTVFIEIRGNWRLNALGNNTKVNTLLYLFMT